MSSIAWSRAGTSRASSTSCRPRYHAPSEIEYLTGDLVEQESVRAALRGCDAVVHLAAISDVNKVLADPELAEAVNAGGTRAVLEAARLEEVPRVVYASTVWVYGELERPRPAERGRAVHAARPSLHRHEARGRNVLLLFR